MDIPSVHLKLENSPDSRKSVGKLVSFGRQVGNVENIALVVLVFISQKINQWFVILNNELLLGVLVGPGAFMNDIFQLQKFLHNVLFIFSFLNQINHLIFEVFVNNQGLNGQFFEFLHGFIHSVNNQVGVLVNMVHEFSNHFLFLH